MVFIIIYYFVSVCLVIAVFLDEIRANMLWWRHNSVAVPANFANRLLTLLDET